MTRLITTAFVAFTLLATPVMAQMQGNEQPRHEENRAQGNVHNEHRDEHKDHHKVRKHHKEHRRNHKERRHDEHKQ